MVCGFQKAMRSFLQKRLKTHALSLQRWAMLAGNNNAGCVYLYPTLPSPGFSGIMKWPESESGLSLPGAFAYSVTASTSLV